MVLAILLFSVCLPFMSFTYLLRGVDLPSIFVILTFGILSVAVAVEWGILVGCLRSTRGGKLLLGVGAIFTLIFWCIITITGANELISTGIGSRLGSSDFWQITEIIFGLSISGMGFLHVLSVAAISPLPKS